MTVYLLLLALIFAEYLTIGRRRIFCANYHENRAVQKTVCYGLTVIAIYCIVLIAFRADTVGIDTRGYVAAYRYRITGSIAQSRLSTTTEWGYLLLQFCLKKLGFGYTAVTLFEAIAYVVPVTCVIFKHSKNPYFSFFLFVALDYYLFSMTATRQAIAMGLCVCAYEMSIQKRLAPFILLVLLASTFHQTAIVFLPAFFLIQLPIKKKVLLAAIIFGAIIISFIEPIREIARSYARINHRNLDTGGTGMYLFMLSIVAIDWIIGMHGREETYPEDTLSYLIVVAIIMYPILQFNPAILRLHFYYTILLVVYIPNVLRKVRNNWIRIPLNCVYTFVGIYYMVNYTFENLGAVPYAFGLN